MHYLGDVKRPQEEKLGDGVIGRQKIKEMGRVLHHFGNGFVEFSRAIFQEPCQRESIKLLIYFAINYSKPKDFS